MKGLGTKVYIASTKDLEDNQVFQSLYYTVSKERQEKIDRLRFPKDKRLSLAAEVLLRKALKLNGIDDFTLEVDENGKPYLKGISGLKFNLSHSEERVMCVISEKEVGCDVEWMKKPNYKMTEYFLTKEEITMLKRLNLEEEKQEMFYRLWTLKESFVKAIGLGMKIPLKDFWFSFEGDTISVHQNINQKTYYLKEYDLKDGYRYAVCSLCPKIDEIVELNLQEYEL